MRAARAEGRKLPADCGEIVEDALTEEDLALPCRPLLAQHGPLPSEGQVLGPVGILLQCPADEPDALTTADLWDDDPAGEMLAQWSCIITSARLAEEAEVLSGSQARSASQVGFE